MLAAPALLAACAAGGGGRPAPPVPARGSTPAPPAPAEASAGHGRTFRYQAIAAAHYLVEREDTVTLFMPDSSTRVESFVTRAWFSVGATAAADGFRLRVVADSVRIAGSVAVPAAALDSARGATWTGTLSPRGLIGDLVATRASTVGEQVRALLPLVFPRLPAADATVGARWTDTTDTERQVDIFQTREHAVTRWDAVGTAARGREVALAITGDAAFTRQGSGAQFGQPLDFASTGTRQLTQYLDSTGQPAGTEGTESEERTVTNPGIGQSVRLRVTARFRVVALPPR